MAKKKTKKKSLANIAGFMAIFVVVVAIAVVTWVRGLSLQEKIDGYTAREEELMNLISKEEERTEDLEERKKYIQTKKYIEEIAKEKFGLIYEDEIMFKSTEN